VLFRSAAGKSVRLKHEAKVVDSVNTEWYQILSETILDDYILPNDSLSVFEEVDQKAEYEGGMYQLIEYINKNKPKTTDAADISGLNIVKFIISDKGDVFAPQIVYSDCEPCKTYTLKMFNNMPRWVPAKHYDIPVYTYYTIPVKY
jgi:hypothetical protein